MARKFARSWGLLQTAFAAGNGCFWSLLAWSGWLHGGERTTVHWFEPAGVLFLLYLHQGRDQTVGRMTETQPHRTTGQLVFGATSFLQYFSYRCLCSSNLRGLGWVSSAATGRANPLSSPRLAMEMCCSKEHFNTQIFPNNAMHL